MKRNYTIDLLKSVCMVMVVFLHATNYGIRNVTVDPLGPTDIVIAFLNSFSYVAVNCFILITGYYSCLSKKTNYKKLISLWLQVFTYSVGVYILLAAFTDAVKFEVKQLIRMALPLLTNQYWFFTVYFILQLVSPYINVLISCMDRRMHGRMLIVCGTLFSIVPALNIFGDSFGTGYGYSLLWFIVLYLVAAYIRKYELKKRKYGMYYVGLGFLVFAAQVLLRYVRVRQYPNIVATILNLQIQYNSPTVFLASICLFLWARNKELRLHGFEKVFSSLAALSFSVYLLHENSMIRNVLWNQWVRLNELENHVFYFTARILISTMMIYTAGIAIEWIRRYIGHRLKKCLLKHK